MGCGFGPRSTESNSLVERGFCRLHPWQRGTARVRSARERWCRVVESIEDIQHEKLTPEELRDAWPVLDSEERLEGFHLLPRDEAEDFYLELSSRG